MQTRTLKLTQFDPQNLAVEDRELHEFRLIMGGHIFFQAMSAACQLDLFTWLSRNPGKPAAAIQKALGLPQHQCRVLLMSLCTLNLIKKNPRGLFRNATLSERLLSRDSEDNVLSVMAAQNFIAYKAMFHLTDALKAGKNVGIKEFPGNGDTLYKRLAKDRKLEKMFHDWMHTISSQANPQLASLPELKKVRHLMDIGGGDGTNTMALQQAHPHLKLTMFDFPTVAKIAAKNFKKNKMDINAVPGDMLKDPFPIGADEILFSHIINIFDAEKNVMLLRKAYQALPKGGMTIIFNSMIENDETGPLRGAELGLYFVTLASGEGMMYAYKDFAAWLRQAGFRKIVTYRMNDWTNHGAVIGIK